MDELRAGGFSGDPAKDWTRVKVTLRVARDEHLAEAAKNGCWGPEKQDFRSSIAAVRLRPHMAVGLNRSRGKALRVVYALGTAATYDKGKGDNATINCRPRAAMSKARHVLASAAKLAEKIVRLDRVEFRITRPTAVIGLLAESMSAQDSPQDRSLAYSILYEVLKQKSVSSWRGTFPQLSQMNLF